MSDIDRIIGEVKGELKGLRESVDSTNTLISRSLENNREDHRIIYKRLKTMEILADRNSQTIKRWMGHVKMLYAAIASAIVSAIMWVLKGGHH